MRLIFAIKKHVEFFSASPFQVFFLFITVERIIPLLFFSRLPEKKHLVIGQCRQIFNKLFTVHMIYWKWSSPIKLRSIFLLTALQKFKYFVLWTVWTNMSWRWHLCSMIGSALRTMYVVQLFMVVNSKFSSSKCLCVLSENMFWCTFPKVYFWVFVVNKSHPSHALWIPLGWGILLLYYISTEGRLSSSELVQIEYCSWIFVGILPVHSKLCTCFSMWLNFSLLM